MKVLHVAPSFARRDGGPSETLRGLVPALTAAGVEVRTLTTNKGIDEKDSDFIQRNNVTIVKSRRPRSWNFAPGIIIPLWRMAAWADVVHVHSVNTFTTSIAMTICRLRRVPYLLEPHGAFDRYHMAQSATKKRIYNWFDSFGFRGLRGVFTSSKRERDDARAVLTAAEFDLPLGVDPGLFDVQRTKQIGTQVLFLGRIAHKKRLDVVIRAIASSELAGRTVSLVVAGPQGDDLEYDPAELAASLGVSERVSLVGPVDWKTRMDLLAASDVFVLPSLDESFGVAVAEAMAAGCAVVASREVGIAGEAGDADALRIADVEPRSVARAIAELSDDTRKAADLGERARAFARGRYEWSNSARAAIHAYESVAHK